MNKNQTLDIVLAIDSYYNGTLTKSNNPFFKDLDINERLVKTVEIYHEILEDYDFDRVKANLKTHVVNSEYPPRMKDLVKGLVVDEKYNIPNREETLKIIETYQVPVEKRATKEQREAIRKRILGY